MGTSSLFRALDSGVSPLPVQTDAAWERSVQCAIALTRHYYPNGDASKHMTLIGSLAKDTAIRPLADVDLVYALPVGTQQRVEAMSGNGQSVLLQEVRRVLLGRFPRTEIRGDGPVVVVEFSSGVSVEVVPAVAVTDRSVFRARCLVPVTRGGGSWELADYGAQWDAVKRLDARRDGQYSRLIRYMKAWRRTKAAVLKSVVLELMALDFFRTWDSEGKKATHVYDDWLVRDFLGYMVDHQDRTYRLPGVIKELSTGYGWRIDAKESFDDATRACLFGDESPSYVINWRKVLGGGFGS